MNGRSNPDGILEKCRLSFQRAGRSIFAVTEFIAACDFPALRAVIPIRQAMPVRQWQSAIGRRLLTPAEEAARQAYFDRKIAAALGHLT